MSGLWLCHGYSMATMGWKGAFGHNFNSSQNIESVGRNDVNAPFLPPTLNILSENIIHSQMADLQNCLYHTGTNSLWWALFWQNDLKLKCPFVGSQWITFSDLHSKRSGSERRSLGGKLMSLVVVNQSGEGDQTNLEEYSWTRHIKSHTDSRHTTIKQI